MTDGASQLVREERLVEFRIVRWPFREPISISRKTVSEAVAMHVEVHDRNGNRGHGEAAGIDYAGETEAAMMADVRRARAAIERGASRDDLLTIMPAGGARASVDSALWDLEAKRDGIDPYRRCGVSKAPVISALTIGIRPPDEVETISRRLSAAALKIKVAADDPLSAVEAARRGAPGTRLIVDPNQAWSIDDLKQLAPKLAELRVDLLEQPIPVGSEQALAGYQSPVPLCADEAVNDIRDLDRVTGCFSVVNIKLEKAGGLTSAWQLANAAEERGLQLMVGCMGGSSLSVAPAMVLAQRCKYVDLDAPILVDEDVEHGFSYERGLVQQPHSPQLWG